jgi:ribonucleoside-diphosphate reductase alpha chain
MILARMPEEDRASAIVDLHTRKRLPGLRFGRRRKFRIPRPGNEDGDFEMFVTINVYPDTGHPGEMFIDADYEGTFARGALDAAAICASMAWQNGVPFEDVMRKLVGLRFDPMGVTGDPEYPIVTSPLDYAARWALDRFGKKEGT